MIDKEAIMMEEILMNIPKSERRYLRVPPTKDGELVDNPKWKATEEQKEAAKWINEKAEIEAKELKKVWYKRKVTWAIVLNILIQAVFFFINIKYIK